MSLVGQAQPLRSHGSNSKPGKAGLEPHTRLSLKPSYDSYHSLPGHLSRDLSQRRQFHMNSWTHSKFQICVTCIRRSFETRPSRITKPSSSMVGYMRARASFQFLPCCMYCACHVYVSQIPKPRQSTSASFNPDLDMMDIDECKTTIKSIPAMRRSEGQTFYIIMQWLKTHEFRCSRSKVAQGILGATWADHGGDAKKDGSLRDEPCVPVAQ